MMTIMTATSGVATIIAHNATVVSLLHSMIRLEQGVINYCYMTSVDHCCFVVCGSLCVEKGAKRRKVRLG